MEQKKDICSYCGSTETILGKQYSQGAVYREDVTFMRGGSPLIHVICRSCGTVIRSYVQYPGNLT